MGSRRILCIFEACLILFCLLKDEIRAKFYLNFASFEVRSQIGVVKKQVVDYAYF
jgi:hypothetical protein